MEGGLPLKFVRGFPAVLRGKTLIIADLHIGIEKEYWRAGIRASGLSDRIIEALGKVLEATKPKKIVVAGDFKHNIPYHTQKEAEDLRRAVEILSSQGELLIVKGNHDGDIEEILQGADVFSPGILEDGVYIIHGHAHPTLEASGAEAIIMGHLHPALALKHKFGRVLKKVFLLGEWNGVPIAVLPAFSPLITGMDIGVSGNRIGPLAKEIGNMQAFLQDGTYIGELV